MGTLQACILGAQRASLCNPSPGRCHNVGKNDEEQGQITTSAPVWHVQLLLWFTHTNHRVDHLDWYSLLCTFLFWLYTTHIKLHCGQFNETALGTRYMIFSQLAKCVNSMVVQMECVSTFQSTILNHQMCTSTILSSVCSVYRLFLLRDIVGLLNEINLEPSLV